MSVTVSPDTRRRLEQARDRCRDARSQMKRSREMISLAAGDDQARRAGEDLLEQARYEEQIAGELERTLLAQISGLGNGYARESFLDDPTAVQALERMATPLCRSGGWSSACIWIASRRSGSRVDRWPLPRDRSIPRRGWSGGRSGRSCPRRTRRPRS